MSDLLYEVTDHVGVITLNRPDAMNSLTYQLYADLEDTVRTSQARALVITGNGRAFCAGDDMKQILGSAKPVPCRIS
jgi:enoyl-CoA hydratase